MKNSLHSNHNVQNDLKWLFPTIYHHWDSAPGGEGGGTKTCSENFAGIQPGEKFLWTLCGSSEQKIVLASSFGYGFVTELGNLHSRMKAGKAALTVPAGSVPVMPALVQADTDSTLVCATSDGYLLAFPLDDVPELTKGKGNKLINVPPKRLKAGEEYMIGLTVMAPKQEILVWAGQRYLRMGKKDIEHFQGDRAKRGRKLPRGFQRVTKIELAED